MDVSVSSTSNIEVGMGSLSTFEMGEERRANVESFTSCVEKSLQLLLKSGGTVTISCGLGVVI